MKRRLFLIVAAGLLISADNPRELVIQAEIERLQGIWRLDWLEEMGRATPGEVNPRNNLTWIVRGNHIVPWLKGTETEVGFRVDPTTEPKRVDFALLRGIFVSDSARAIYSLEGDFLRICFAIDGHRPTQFSARRGEPQGILILRRVGY
jgi:uncharacterized protein (TIGR03067 family)